MEKPYNEKMGFASQLFEGIKAEALRVYDDYPGMMRKVDQQTTEFLERSLRL
jgi:hypothetical protein